MEDIEEEVKMKKCVGPCGLVKGVSCFNKNRSKNDGFSTECKDCVNDYNRHYRANSKNKIKAAEYNKAYRKDNAEELEDKRKIYAAEHKDEQRDRAHQHYETNKEPYKARVAQYKKERPEQYKEYEYRRRAKKKGALVVEKIRDTDVIAMYGDQCFYCEDGQYEHLDHYIPLSKGGQHTLDNVRPACMGCNLSKNNKMPEIWLKEKRR
jgi:5-methylcytosine-specific restriction endonuclease McrA